MPQSSVRYNLKWLHKNKSTSVTSAQEMCATYKRKMLSVLKANKALVRALAAARAEMAELKAAASRWGKNEDLYLPILKGWLEADMGHIRALFESHVRASTLLKDLLTPDANITLTAASSLLHETACESPPKEPPSLHPPGSRLCNQACSMSMVLEEDDEDGTAVVEPLQDIAQTPEPEISLSSREQCPSQRLCLPCTVTVRKKGSRSGHRCSLPVDEPLPASADQSPVVPSFAVVDTEASILVTEMTGQEKNIVCAETVVVPPPDKLKGHSAHEYSAAFSHRPKIPRTPCSPTKQGARFNAWLEDAGSSPAFTRVQRRRASEAAALLPWPGKRGAMAQGPLGRRSSMPAARDRGPGAANASSPTCVLDEAFIASPSPTQALSGNTLLPREVADFRRDENSPPGAKTRPRKSAFKSRPSEAGRKKAANRVTFFVQKGRTQMAGDAAGDVTNMAIPPAESGDGQWERGGGDGPQDGEGGPQLQCSVPLDVAGARPTGNPAVHPKQDHCVDEKPLQARKSRGKRSQGLKEATDPKQPAPPPQPAHPSSPHARRSGRLPLAEAVAAGRSSSSVGGGSPARRSSGRPARSTARCATYKEANLIVKLRRP